MSFGHLGACPCCWEDPEDCHCSKEDLDAYYKRIEDDKKKMEEPVKIDPKDPWRLKRKNI